MIETPDSVPWFQKPEFAIGQKVWYIRWDDNCPAAMGESRISESQVSSIKAEVVLHHKKGVTLVCTGYCLPDFNLNRDIDPTFFRRDELYATEAEAEHNAHWFSVNVTDEQWMKAIGQRESWGEYHDAKQAFEKEWERKDRPWIHHVEAPVVDSHDSELGVCCTNISEIRDLLIKCSRHGGLIRRDVIALCENFICGGHSEMLNWQEMNEDSALREILKQLCVDLVRKEVENEKDSGGDRGNEGKD